MKFKIPGLHRVFNNACSSAYIFTTICLIVFSSCKKSSQQATIPNVPVNFTIQLSLPSYTNLNSPGGSVEIPSVGFRGIIVYRLTIDQFVAYDMACPYDPGVDGAILHVDSSGINTRDSKCGSRFGLTSGGSVVNGPATLPMKPYNTAYDAVTGTVAVFN